MSQSTSALGVSHQILQQSDHMSLVHKLAWFSVLAMIFVIPWGNGLWVGIIKIFAVSGIGLAALLLTAEGTHRSYGIFSFLAVVLGAWHMIALLWTPDLDWGVTAANEMVQMVIMALLYAYLINTPFKFRGGYQAYLAGTMVASAIISYNYFNGIHGHNYGRYTVPNIETDRMSVVLSLGIPMAAWLAIQYKNRLLQLGFLLCIPVIFYAIFLTGTRTGFVTGLVGVMYLAFTQRKASYTVKVIYLMMTVAVIVIVISLAPESLVERIFSISSAIQTGDLNSREKIWQYSLEFWESSPILGGGTGSLGHILNVHHIEHKLAHNSFIQLLVEHGVIGLTIYLLLLGSLIYYVIRCPMDIRYYLMALLFILLVSQISLHTHKHKEIWFVMAIIAAQAHYYSRMYPRRVFMPVSVQTST